MSRHPALFWLWLAVIVVSQSGLAMRVADLFARNYLDAGPGGAGDWAYVAQKLYHVFLFAVFGWLLAATGRRSARACVLWCVLVGIGAEALQLFADGRTPQARDAVLNFVSGLAAFFLFRSRAAAPAGSP